MIGYECLPENENSPTYPTAEINKSYPLDDVQKLSGHLLKAKNDEFLRGIKIIFL